MTLKLYLHGTDVKPKREEFRQITRDFFGNGFTDYWITSLTDFLSLKWPVVIKLIKLCLDVSYTDLILQKSVH